MIPIAKPIIEEEEKNAVMNVLNSGMLAQGKKVKELEEEFCKISGTKYAIAVNNGTAALHTAIYATGIKEGDEVITTPFTFVASANSIIMQGAKPVFVDIDEKTFNIDPDKIQEKINNKTKAILPVDLFGQVADYDKIKNIADENNLKIIEDACQAHLSEKDGKRAGCFGDIAAFSLYATKNMMTGEGGIITTDNEEYAELCKRFRHHGQSEKTRYEYFDLGYNYRMTDMQAAIGVEQLKKLSDWTETRRKNAKLLTESLKDVKGIIIPYEVEGNKHVYHQYTIKITDECKLTREKIMDKLKENGIGFGIFYPKPLHLHPNFEKLGYKEGDFPISEKIAKQILSLPVHAKVSNDDIEKIIKVFKENC